MGQRAKLNLCLERLGGLNLTTLENRKLLQKKVYFLQEFGIKLGYSYGFYIYGPYSSDLSTDAYFLMRLRANAPDTLEAAELSQAEEKSLNRAVEFFGEIAGDNTEVASKLEIMSSLHFLWAVSYFKSKSKQEIFAKVREKKPWVTAAALKTGWALLNRYGLVA